MSVDTDYEDPDDGSEVRGDLTMRIFLRIAVRDNYNIMCEFNISRPRLVGNCRNHR